MSALAYRLFIFIHAIEGHHRFLPNPPNHARASVALDAIPLVKRALHLCGKLPDVLLPKSLR